MLNGISKFSAMCGLLMFVFGFFRYGAQQFGSSAIETPTFDWPLPIMQGFDQWIRQFSPEFLMVAGGALIAFSAFLAISNALYNRRQNY